MVAAPKDTLEDAELLARAGVALPGKAKVTPMLRQWLLAKAKAKDAILLFRMGDFYELFADDAVVAAPIVDLVLTSRDRDKGEDALPMAGFPHHQAPQYIAKLIERGFKVAVCEQLEDPALARGIVKRDVTRVVTPGMVLEDESLDARANNWLVAIAKKGRDERHRWGLCALDLSTGEHRAATIASEELLFDEVARLDPREIVVEDDGSLPEETVERLGAEQPGRPARRIERRPPPKEKRALLRSLGPIDRALEDPERRAALIASELLLHYVEETQGRVPPHVSAPRPWVVEQQLLLDATTRAHLDLAGPPGDLRRPGTLLHVVDRTLTAAGGRRLLRWLYAPSTSMDVVAARLDRVEALVEDPGLRAALRDELRAVLDVERILGRVAGGRAVPRDLGRLRDSLARLPRVASLLVAGGDALAELAADVDPVEDVQALLARALVDDPPTSLGGDPVFRPGYDPVLDDVTSASSGGRDEIAALEAKERERWGIPSLKIKYNRVFGYTFELTKAHVGKAPPHFKRKQTIANGERYVTDDLVALEERVEGAEQRRVAREAELFAELCGALAAEARRVLASADVLADVDALAAFAEVSDQRRFRRPKLLPSSERRLRIVDGRHPIVEAALDARGEPYVPSSIELSADERQVVLVTGPNMAGKSTLMRQVALVQVLAQAGCFVPAAEATLSLCDRVFTRVGASDDLASGRSTFMVEMTETSHILRNATPASLVLLDEIGRGTSTFDGLSLAWAVAEHLHDVVGARTLFATHYHELTQLADHLPRARNMHVVVKEWNDEIVFTRTLEEGGAERSYGIHVARLAGLPSAVVARAKEVLASLEGEHPPSHRPDGPKHPRIKRGRAGDRAQMGLFARAGAADDDASPLDPPVDPIVGKLLGLDVNRMTPLGALNALADLVDEARRRR